MPDRPAVDPVDPVSLPEFADDEGLQLDAAPGALCRGNGRRSIADRDRSADKSRRRHRNLARGKTSDGEQLLLCGPSSLEGETGQRPAIVAA